MTTSISPPRGVAIALRPNHRQATARQALPRSSGPCCSLKAQPQPHAQPVPTWDELLGQR